MILTAYNEDVQRYIQGTKLNQATKEKYLTNLKNSIIATGKSFAKMFSGKKQIVLDEIMYLVSTKGIWKIGAQSLADRCQCSISVVYKTVQAIKETDEILVARIANNRAGRYIFVLKSHPNFKEIMKEVFFLEDEPSLETVLETTQETGLENLETVEAVSVEGEKTTSNNINLNNNLIKQEKEYIKESIENELISVSSENISEKEMKHVNTYFTNEYQFSLYHWIKGGIYTPVMKRNASVIGLRLGSNVTLENYQCAIKVVNKMDKYIENGGKIDSIPAYFSDMYALEVKVYEYNLQQTTNVPECKESHTFYNWLEPHKGQPKNTFYNWLECY